MAGAISEYDLVSMGEMMLRLAAPRFERLRHTRSFDLRLCGAQFNVAADLAVLGRQTAFLSKLPNNELGLRAIAGGQGYGIDMSHVLLVPNSRIGAIYVEFAAEPRTGIHLYDRDNSAASTVKPADFDFAAVLQKCRLAYTDGIFLGLNEGCYEASLEFLRIAKAQGSTVCFDMNYRQTLWKEDQADKKYRSALKTVDIVVTNRSVSQLLFGFRGCDIDLAKQYQDQFGCGTVCITARRMIGPFRGEWRCSVVHGHREIQQDPIQFDVVDRFGAGDAFLSGFLYYYLEGDIERAVRFGNNLCALAHTIEGDVADLNVSEVEVLLRNGYDPQIKR